MDLKLFFAVELTSSANAIYCLLSNKFEAIIVAVCVFLKQKFSLTIFRLFLYSLPRFLFCQEKQDEHINCLFMLSACRSIAIVSFVLLFLQSLFISSLSYFS